MGAEIQDCPNCESWRFKAIMWEAAYNRTNEIFDTATEDLLPNKIQKAKRLGQFPNGKEDSPSDVYVAQQS